VVRAPAREASPPEGLEDRVGPAVRRLKEIPAAWRKHSPDLAQMRVAVANVLEDVEAEDRVERGVGKGERRPADRADRQLAVQAAAVVDQRRVDLDAARVVALAAQIVQQGAAAAADLEDAIARPERH